MTTKAALETEELIARIRLQNTEHDRKLQETLLAPKLFRLNILTAVAISFAAGGTFAAGIAAIIKVLA
jgi:hypothetical protein